MAMRHALNNGADENGTFDRKFLLQILTMGHAQFAQWIGARGPNLAINNACASTPAAFAIAEDWLDSGRCDRVIVISGDDSTGDDLMEWIGAGFAAAGAHSMGDVVEEVALPFDVRRNGMLLGMGGAAFVIEKSSHADERGVVPYAELLGAHIGNSAFHPTRLDVTHVASTFDEFVTDMENRWGIDRHEIAPKTTFMSHEPFTPPRGGSAAAEIESLRGTFKDSAESLIITNTKGFTGHPMGVGVEDATGLYGLASGRLPPIANFQQPDPALGNLRLSEGGEYDVEYMLRHAAGFGSQIALTMFKRIARTLNRVDRDSVEKWANLQAGDDVELRLLKRKLVAYISPDESLIGGVEGSEWQVSAQDAQPDSTLSTTISPKSVPSPPDETPKQEVKDEIAEETPSAVLASQTAPEITVGEHPEDLEQQVVETVAKHTGYPTDFIELDQDLEGELGIDTVKQAEIMADLREIFSLPVDDSFQLREHPTLNHMISYIVSMGEGSEEQQNPQEEQPLQSNTVDEESVGSNPPSLENTDSDIESAVLSIVVKHTGYPEDFLELDQDLEGELGIDTVKQAEIMADCREHFSLPVDESFQLRDYPTLADMISYIDSMRGGEPVVTRDSGLEEKEVVTAKPELETVEPSPSETPVESTVRRWVVEVEEADESEAHPIDMAGSYIIVTDDSWGLGNAICEQLESSGSEAVRLMLDPSITSKIKIEKDGGIDIIRLDPGNQDHLSQFGEILTDLDIAGVIHTAPCTLAGIAWAEVTSQQQTQMVCHGLFGVLQQIDAKLANRSDGIVCSISALDGRHGNGGYRFNPLGAGAHGIVKSFGRERPNIRARAIDVAPELLVNADKLAATILSEIEYMGPRELGIDGDGRRWQVCIYDEPHESERQSLNPEDVFIVSGGGSGVTAACIVGLAQANRGMGCHFALLGRTKLDDSLSSLADASEEALQQRKMELRDQMQGQSKSGKVTIVDWEKAWSKIERSIDIHKTLSDIEESGNTATYYACDVTVSKQVRKVLKKLKKKHSPVTGIIHGAGIEDSKMVADKEWDTFSNVMSVKVDGWQSLVNAVKDHSTQLRYCCAFTSIAGRFGNGGQADYAAANCILDAEMSRLAHIESEPHGVALAWTGWQDVGMATRGSIESVFEEAGIETVSVEKGVSLFVDEVMRGGKRRVVLAGNLGVLNDDGSDREPPQRLPPDVTALLADAKRFPFVDKVVALQPFDTLSYECTIDVNSYPFLEDHAIDNVPYHPGVMALEMFSQGAQLLWPPCTVIGFAGVRFGLPIKLLKQEQKLRVVAEFSHQNSENVWVKCRLESDLMTKSGEKFGEPRIHHEGLVRMLKRDADRGLLKLPSIGTPSRGGVILGSDFVYQRFFHGPRFQSHGGILGGCSIDDMFGADGIALSRHQLANTNQFSVGDVTLEAQPMLIEACFQNAGMVAMEIDGLQSLPVGIEMLELIRIPEKTDSLRMRAVRRGAEDDGVTIHDCLVVDQDGKPVVSMKGLRLKGMAPISEGESFSLNRN